MIPPWFFYLSSLFDTLKFGLMFVSLVGIIFYLYGLTVEERSINWILIACIIGIVFAMFLPGEVTMTRMLVASYTDSENIAEVYQVIINTASTLLNQ